MLNGGLGGGEYGDERFPEVWKFDIIADHENIFS